MNFIGLGIFLVFICGINCQPDASPFPGHDYILRSCISSAELIRNHRKASKTDKLLLTNTVAEPSDLKQPFTPFKRLRTINSRGKKRKIEETPLQTLDIRRSGKSSQSPLPFMRIGAFPEVSADRNHQQRSTGESEVIVIKPSV